VRVKDIKVHKFRIHLSKITLQRPKTPEEILFMKNIKQRIINAFEVLSTVIKAIKANHKFIAVIKH